MKTTAKGLLAGGLLLVAAIGLASPVLAATEKADSWDGFRVLTERNMFLRDRRPPRTVRPDSPGPPPADSGERRVVLTGTALCAGEFVAFFEDTRTGKTLRTRAGGAVGAGKLKTVTLDGAEYEAGERTTKIEIGWSLAGVPASLPSRRRTATATSQSASPPDESQAKPEAAADAADAKEPPEQEADPSPDTASDAKPKETLSPAGAGDADIADILERMRRRREEELKK